jgi:hypothetical protein
MLKHHPYKVINRVKNSKLSQKAIQKYILVRLEHLISLFTKINNGNNDLLIDTRKMNLNIGINQELIPLHSGLDFCFGKNQQ